MFLFLVEAVIAFKTKKTKPQGFFLSGLIVGGVLSMIFLFL